MASGTCGKARQLCAMAQKAQEGVPHGVPLENMSPAQQQAAQESSKYCVSATSLCCTMAAIATVSSLACVRADGLDDYSWTDCP